MAKVYAALVYFVIFVSAAIPGRALLSGAYDQRLNNDKCDTQCRWACLLLSTVENVRGNSENETTSSDSVECPKGPQGPRGLRGERGPIGPIGPRGFSGLKGEPGETENADMEKIDKIVADTVRGMFAQSLQQTSCENVRRDLAKSRNSSGGVYEIFPPQYREGTEVYCDLDTGGERWTVFQRRMDGSVNFVRPWNDYVNGFGSPDKEYWMGLEKLHQLTRGKSTALRIDLEYWDGRRKYVEHKSFSVAGLYSKYRARVGRVLRGNVTSSFRNLNHRFSTYDQDNDEYSDYNCAELWGGGGWWFNSCSASNLNGPYSKTPDVEERSGVIWRRYRGSLKFVEMKFRRDFFRFSH